MVDQVAGAEGAPRYKRLGLVMLLAGLICALILLRATLYEVGDETWSYSSISGGPEETPLYIPNEEVLWYANIALVGFVLLAMVGILFIFEGMGVVNLRRSLGWHSEVRATALYAFAVLVSLVGVLASGSLVAFSFSEPVTQLGSGLVPERTEVTAVGPAWALFIGALVAVGMLLMTYYNGVLSIYRGGYVAKSRRLVRLGLGICILSFVAVLLLHSSNVMVIDINFEPEAGNNDYTIPYTMADIDYLVATHQAEDIMRELDTSLEVLGWSLLVCGALGLFGLVGVAGLSMNAGSRKARRAISLMALSFVPGIFCIWGAMSAASHIASFGGGGLYFAVIPLVGTPILAGFFGAIVMVFLSLVGLFTVGVHFVRDAIVVPAPTADGVPSVDGAPVDVEALGEAPLRPPVAPVARGRSVALSLAVVAIVIVAAVGLLAFRGGEDGDDGGSTPSVSLADMSTFEQTVTSSNYLEEGENLALDAVAETLWGELEGGTVCFFNAVYVHVSWTDEPDQGLLINRWENQPDTFQLVVSDREGLDEVSDVASNPRGGLGDLELIWAPSGTWVGVGNSSLVAPDDVDVAWNDEVTISIFMEEAGDFESPLGRTQADAGNGFSVTIEIEGHRYP